MVLHVKEWMNELQLSKMLIVFAKVISNYIMLNVSIYIGDYISVH